MRSGYADGFHFLARALLLQEQLMQIMTVRVSHFTGDSKENVSCERNSQAGLQLKMRKHESIKAGKL